MSAVFQKLNLKGLSKIMVLNPPPSFEAELAALGDIQVIRDTAGQAVPDFLLAFVLKQWDIEKLSDFLRPGPVPDPIIWFAYPKGTSKNYQSDFNRDNGWESIKAKGLDTVRLISIDEDWSALRFRYSQFIKSK